MAGIAADFADAAEVQRLLALLGGVHVLINNVGLFELEPFVEIADEDWSRYFDVNLRSGVRLSRELLPGMLDAGWGRIIFIGSEPGVNIPADMTHYGVTKAGMLAFSNVLAKLTRGTGVTVNTILGGPTYADGVSNTVDSIAQTQGLSTEDLKAAIISQNQTSLLERFIEPDEIANLAVYLSSPLSSGPCPRCPGCRTIREYQARKRKAGGVGAVGFPMLIPIKGFPPTGASRIPATPAESGTHLPCRVAP